MSNQRTLGVGRLVVLACFCVAAGCTADGSAATPSSSSAVPTLPAPTPLPSSVPANPVNTPTPSTVNIRDYPFANAVYRLGQEWDGEFTTVAANIKFDSQGSTWSGGIDEPTFGDIDGDGVDEAVVIGFWNAVDNAPTFAGGVFLFGIVNGEVTQLASLMAAPEDNLSFVNARIEDGYLLVHESIEGFHCCPEREQTLRFSYSNGELTQDAVVDEWALVDMWRETDVEIKFLPGTDRADIQIGTQDSVGTFVAASGQTISVDARAVPPPGQIIVELDGQLLGAPIDVGSQGTIALPSDGAYQLRVIGVSRDETGTMIVRID